MENFPNLDTLRKYAVEVVLITIAVITAVSALILFSYDAQAQKKPPVAEKTSGKMDDNTIIVDIAGAVKKPGIYAVAEGARVKDVLQKAGGFSQDLDFTYVSRTLNQAKVLTDQEKVYIPRREEPLPGPGHEDRSFNIPELINVNTAEPEELDSLPSVGSVTTQKIVSGRPYSSVQDLLDKKILGPAAFEKIQSLITVIN